MLFLEQQQQQQQQQQDGGGQGQNVSEHRDSKHLPYLEWIRYHFCIS